MREILLDPRDAKHGRLEYPILPEKYDRFPTAMEPKNVSTQSVRFEAKLMQAQYEGTVFLWYTLVPDWQPSLEIRCLDLADSLRRTQDRLEQSEKRVAQLERTLWRRLVQWLSGVTKGPVQR